MIPVSTWDIWENFVKMRAMFLICNNITILEKHVSQLANISGFHCKCQDWSLVAQIHLKFTSEKLNTLDLG